MNVNKLKGPKPTTAVISFPKDARLKLEKIFSEQAKSYSQQDPEKEHCACCLRNVHLM